MLRMCYATCVECSVLRDFEASDSKVELWPYARIPELHVLRTKP